MLIYSIKLHGDDYKLKYPIEILENESYVGGKLMYIVSVDDFRLLAIHDQLDIAKTTIQESLNSMIHSYLFEVDYIFPEAKKAVNLQKIIKEHVYG